MSNMVTLKTLELLGGWKSWSWEISEVLLYDRAFAQCKMQAAKVCGWNNWL